VLLRLRVQRLREARAAHIRSRRIHCQNPYLIEKDAFLLFISDKLHSSTSVHPSLSRSSIMLPTQ
jgi:hypothetical protein